jgi:hypothetical protein
MMESLYANNLVLSGLWVATSLLMLLVWGLLAWAVVSILSRRGFGRRRVDPASTRQPDETRPPPTRVA